MERQTVLALMESTKSPEEWRAATEMVREAHGGRYPDYWFPDLMLDGGIFHRVSATWPKELAR